MSQVTRAHGVDISKWQEPYEDDQIDEGFPLDFVIQKAADGTVVFSDPDYYGHAKWKIQRDSIEGFLRKLMYHWFQTEQNSVEQAVTAIVAMEKDAKDYQMRYLKLVVDFEAYLNTISKQTAYALQEYVEYIWDNSDIEVVLYCNYWIYVLLLSWLPKEFMEKLDFWYAGGMYYNTAVTEPIADDITPVLPAQNKGWKLWQYSADGNRLADELDFGEAELSSIDLDVFNGTPEEMDVWLGLASAPPPITAPECDHTAWAEDARDIENLAGRLANKLEE